MTRAIAVPNLLPGTAHLWEFNLDDFVFADLLSDDERERAARFHFDRDRNRFQAGRIALRLLLGAYLRVPPGEIRFSYGPAGKPAIAGAGISFNLAHSGPYAMLGVSGENNLGVDIELIREITDMPTVAQYSFARGEFSRWRALPRDQQIAAFYRCWTRKEAYLKAIGEGIALRLQKFEVAFEPGSPARFLNGVGEGWKLLDFSKEPVYAAALACDGTLAAVECHRLACA